MLDSATSTAEVLDAGTGKVIASFPSGPGGSTESVDQSLWSPGGTRAISVVTKIVSKQTSQVSVQLWNASSGTLIRTLATFNNGIQPLGLSADGKYIAVQKDSATVEIWNLSSGTQVSSFPFGGPFPSAVAWSPDDTLLAPGLPTASEVQIWTVATGQLSSSFKGHDASVHVIGALAWSSDGKYLAESGSDIHIWNVKAQHIAATFGKVDKLHWIATLTWSPDSTMLVSSTNVIQKNDAQNTVHVWQLS